MYRVNNRKFTESLYLQIGVIIVSVEGDLPGHDDILYLVTIV